MSERDAIQSAAKRQRPASTKRTAPKPEKSLDEIQAEQQKYGISKSYRLSKEIVEAVAEAANQHDVGIGEFVEFALRATLKMLDAERIELPVTERKVTGKMIAERPSIPESYRG